MAVPKSNISFVFAQVRRLRFFAVADAHYFGIAPAGACKMCRCCLLPGLFTAQINQVVIDSHSATSVCLNKCQTVTIQCFL